MTLILNFNLNRKDKFCFATSIREPSSTGALCPELVASQYSHYLNPFHRSTIILMAVTLLATLSHTHAHQMYWAVFLYPIKRLPKKILLESERGPWVLYRLILPLLMDMLTPETFTKDEKKLLDDMPTVLDADWEKASRSTEKILDAYSLLSRLYREGRLKKKHPWFQAKKGSTSNNTYKLSESEAQEWIDHYRKKMEYYLEPGHLLEIVPPGAILVQFLLESDDAKFFMTTLTAQEREDVTLLHMSVEEMMAQRPLSAKQLQKTRRLIRGTLRRYIEDLRPELKQIFEPHYGIGKHLERKRRAAA